ncbi:YbaB/EbfC family nucleoid-associated protein [Mycobacterium sp. MMS18-G62]
MSNDALRHEMTEVLALVQEQLADIAGVQKRQAELTAMVAVADGMVEVTVNAAGHVIKTVIDDAYLDEFEFDELADHITEAAQSAARDVALRATEMLAPINERRKRFPSLSDIVEGAPDLRDLVPAWPPPDPAAPPHQHDADQGDVSEDSTFPTVRR